MTAHVAGELAVHVHPVSVVTRVPVVPPAAGMVRSVGVNEYVHGEAACVIATCDPLTAIFPLRFMPWGFAVVERVIDASPCPDPGDIWIHELLLDAVHAHSRSVTRRTSTRPPPAGIVGTVPMET
jgi:hypothetical protein